MTLLEQTCCWRPNYWLGKMEPRELANLYHNELKTMKLSLVPVQPYICVWSGRNTPSLYPVQTVTCRLIRS